MKQDAPFLLRLQRKEKEIFERCAEVSGMKLTEWIRQRLRAAAAKEMKEAGEVADFLAPPTKESDGQ